MASLRSLNQTHPFWDWVNSFDDPNGPPAAFGFPGQGPWGDHRRGGAPFRPNDPAPGDAPPPFPAEGQQEESAAGEHEHEKHTPDGSDTEQEEPANHARGGEGSKGHGSHESHGPHGHHGPHAHHNHHSHHGPPPHTRGGYGGFRGRHGPGFGCGRRGRGGPPGFAFGGNGFGGSPWNMNSFGDFMRGFAPRDAQSNSQGDFMPAIDVFDTESAYVVHVSLPGAKKEDTAVSWDPEANELSVTGVIHRPGNEEFLKTLEVGERKVGAFERKVRLGTRASPAKIDVDGISAKLEDGVLKINVPKEDKDFVEIKKVDVL